MWPNHKGIIDISESFRGFEVCGIQSYFLKVEEVLQVIRNRLNTDTSFPGRSPLQVEDVMELLDICLTTTYFQFEDQQK
jgi:hypothetical protein